MNRNCAKHKMTTATKWIARIKIFKCVFVFCFDTLLLFAYFTYILFYNTCFILQGAADSNARVDDDIDENENEEFLDVSLIQNMIYLYSMYQHSVYLSPLCYCSQELIRSTDADSISQEAEEEEGSVSFSILYFNRISNQTIFFSL